MDRKQTSKGKPHGATNIVGLATCCETGCPTKVLVNSDLRCKSCNKPMCGACHEATVARGNGPSGDFYRQYIGTCDICIWFSLG